MSYNQNDGDGEEKNGFQDPTMASKTTSSNESEEIVPSPQSISNEEKPVTSATIQSTNGAQESGAYSQPSDMNTTIEYNQAQTVPSGAKGPSGFAIAALVLGIVSLLLTCCIGPLNSITGITGLILGIVDLVKFKGQENPGKVMSIISIVLNALAIIVGILLIIFVVVGITSMPYNGGMYY